MGASLSVIIPTYNRAHTLPRALNSVLQQSLAPEEIIVVDDGSTDNTFDLVQNQYPKVTYLRQQRQGVSHARNVGIAAARGEWIAFLDSDDCWQQHKCQKQLRALNLDKSFSICHTDELWYRHGVRVNPMKKHQKRGGWIYPYCLPLCAVSPSSVVIHHSLFKTIGHFNETLPACEDYDLWLRITCRYPVLYLSEPLTVKYGGHEDQLSKQYWGMDRFRVQALMDNLQNPFLTDDYRQQTLVVLLKKLAILIQGARKRHKITETIHYENLLQRYQRQLNARPSKSHRCPSL